VAVKSKAQRRKFAELLVQGKIDKEVFEWWNRGAGKKELPEHVSDKGGRKTKERKSKRKKKRHP
jgi:hypothetical protein